MSPSPAPARLLAILAWATLLVQGAALAAGCLNTQITSDVLFPLMFARDAVSGALPLSGWTLGSSAYFFPDLAALCSLVGATGMRGGALAAYAILFGPAFALAAGWFLRELDPGSRFPWLRGALAANAVLALRLVPGAAPLVWLMALPGFHGGCLIGGLALGALASRQCGGRSGAAGWIATATLSALCLLSDSLVLPQFILPIALALAWQAWRNPGAEGWNPREGLKRWGTAVAAGIALFALARLALDARQIFFPSRVFRYAPTALGMVRAAASLGGDAVGALLPLALSSAAALALCIPEARRQAGTPARFALLWMVLGITATASAVVVLTYWRNPLHIRYLWNALALPWVALAAVAGSFRTPWCARIAAVALVPLLAVGAAASRAGTLALRTPSDIRRLDEALRALGQTRGLADYWTTHRFNLLARPGIRLAALRARPNSTSQASEAYFWANNAFSYLDRDPATGRWAEPRYTFIVANGLDEASLAARFGAPARVVQAGVWRIWLLSDPKACSDLVLGDVRRRLEGRRWEQVAPDLQQNR